MDGSIHPNADRRAWLGLLARAPADRLLTLWAAYGPAPDHDTLRPAEVGTVMVRGRIGGTGGPFNLGEMTVTRCSVRLSCGTVGHGHVQGRSKPAATAAALIDALMQTAAGVTLRPHVLDPLQAEATARTATRAAKAAATKVEFFTLVRGED